MGHLVRILVSLDIDDRLPRSVIDLGHRVRRPLKQALWLVLDPVSLEPNFLVEEVLISLKSWQNLLVSA